MVGAMDASDDANKRFIRKLNIPSYPHIMYLGFDKSQDLKEFKGWKSLTPENIAKKVGQILLKELKEKIKKFEEGQFSKTQISGPGSEGEVVELDDENFEKLVMASEDVWVVNFYEKYCKHCEAFAPEYTKAALKMKKKVKFGKIEGPKHQDFAKRFGVTWYPNVVGFEKGIKTELKAIKYDMKGRAADNIVAFAKDMKRYEMTDDVIELTEANFDEKVFEHDGRFLVEFYAPWCNTCKQIAPDFSQVASHLKNKVKVGKIDGEKYPSIIDRFNITGYPTIFLYGAGVGQENKQVTQYQGTFKKDDILNYIYA